MSRYEFNRSFSTSVLTSTILEINNHIRQQKLVVIADENVYSLYQKTLFKSLSVPVLLLPAGERTKSQRTVTAIYRFLSAGKVTRDTVVYAIGGGTIMDVAAYAVSTFKRGCILKLIPTTLLGMVDAAIGGKTAINCLRLKNAIGTFYPAEEVLIWSGFLKTLTAAEINNGIAEMLKLWFIVPVLPAPPHTNKAGIDDNQILHYAKVKLDICCNDLTDTGNRKLLNLGHTFGHINESTSNYRIAHGNTVIIGIVIAARISNRMGCLKERELQKIEAVIRRYDFPVSVSDLPRDKYLKAFCKYCFQDKKNTATGLDLILFNGFRNVFIKRVTVDTELTKLLADCF